MTAFCCSSHISGLNLSFTSSPIPNFVLKSPQISQTQFHQTVPHRICVSNPNIFCQFSRHPTFQFRAVMADETTTQSGNADEIMKLLFVEMGVGYDQHGQNITAAAMRACRDAIASNSIPAFRRGSIPGVSFEQMKLRIKLGVPQSLQQSLDIEKVKSVFPYGKILDVEVVDGGLICSSGVHVEEMGDKNDDCYIVNAAVYVGY